MPPDVIVVCLVNSTRGLSMNYYKSRFDGLPYFQPEITVKHIERILACCTYFETKDQHASALNSPLLGVVPIYFTSIDVAMLYDVFQVNEDDITKIVQESEFTDPNWVVTNDPYNNVVIYLVHRIMATSLDGDIKKQGAMALLKLLHYKYFTSLVFNSYKFGADEETMSWVINTLSKKYDLTKYETWKAVIEARCEDILTPGSLHYDTLLKFTDDVAIIYVISDTQSNLRQKIVRINCLYYEAKAQKESIGSYSSLDNIDGQKIIASTTEMFDVMISGMSLQAQSPARLLDFELLEVIASKYKEVSAETLRLTLTKFCELTVEQASSQNYKRNIYLQNKETGEKDLVYVSTQKLLSEFLQKSYRYCIMSKDVNMSSKKSILIKVINTYTSSRVIDPDILTIKRSFMYFVLNCEISRRPATNAALSVCLVIYFLIRSFDYVQ